jgi:hypothetical protein
MTPNDNPYSAPKSRVAGSDAAPGSAFKAVGLGMAVDIGGTLVATTLLGVIWGAVLVATGTSMEELQAIASIPRGSPLWIASQLLGVLFSVLGGYVCARIAKRREYALGAIQVTLTTLIALVFMARRSMTAFDVVALAVDAAFVMSGVWIGRVRNRKVI